VAFICVAAALNATLTSFSILPSAALSPSWLNLGMILTLGGAGLHWAQTPVGEIRGSARRADRRIPADGRACGRAGQGRMEPRSISRFRPDVREIARLMAPVSWNRVYQVNIYVRESARVSNQ